MGEPSLDNDLIHARRLTAEVARVRQAIDNGGLSLADYRALLRKIVSLVSDLEHLIDVLTRSRDALGLKLTAHTRQLHAITTYGRMQMNGRQHSRAMRSR